MLYASVSSSVLRKPSSFSSRTFFHLLVIDYSLIIFLVQFLFCFVTVEANSGSVIIFSFIAAAIMSAIYDEHKDEDGFLYMSYSGENTFGIF